MDEAPTKRTRHNGGQPLTHGPYISRYKRPNDETASRRQKNTRTIVTPHYGGCAPHRITSGLLAPYQQRDAAWPNTPHITRRGDCTPPKLLRKELCRDPPTQTSPSLLPMPPPKTQHRNLWSTPRVRAQPYPRRSQYVHNPTKDGDEEPNRGPSMETPRNTLPTRVTPLEPPAFLAATIKHQGEWTTLSAYLGK